MKKQIIHQLAFIISISFLFYPSNGFSQVADSFFVAGIHPAASIQTTSTGKELAILFPWNGKLFSGYGDYGANTGPIDIYSFSPDSLTFTYECQANTEAVYTYKAINGMLYAPAIDRKSYSIAGDYIKMDSTGNCGNYDFGGSSTHVYDAVRFNDTILFMTGSRNDNAVVWRSNDNGQKWSIVRDDTTISGISHDFARYYFGGMYNGNLYVQARDAYGSLHPNSKVYNGTTWTNGPTLFLTGGAQGWKPLQFGGKLVYRHKEPPGSGQLLSFDGSNVSLLNSLWIFDHLVDLSYYYVLVDSGFGIRKLLRTSDLINWV
ncbi:MAG: hypothetical protein ABIQ11_04105, partial [Saprospiraceae bacterium]